VYVGAPEDLVISGAFEDAFRGEGVSFDRATGSFSVERERGRAVVVRGHGIPHTWTRRALKRAGFTVQMSDSANGASAAPTITLSGDEYQPIWHLYRHNSATVCHSIRDLLAAIHNPAEETMFI
jgi:iron complex transport system ATP-binding protein